MPAHRVTALLLLKINYFAMTPLWMGETDPKESRRHPSLHISMLPLNIFQFIVQHIPETALYHMQPQLKKDGLD